MINYHDSLTQQQYVDLLVNLISSAEGPAHTIYKHGPDHTTIGYGYTFVRNNNLALWQAAGISLTDTEISLLKKIDAAKTNSEKDQLALNFSKVISNPDAVALLKMTYPQYKGPANDLGMPLSTERVAFVSLTYNRGITAVHKKMHAFYEAVQTGNRAEAWFQIRYNSQTKDPNNVNGIANRRYAESELFCLYDPDVFPTRDEAFSVYRMFTTHRDDILAYEKLYTPPANQRMTDELMSAATLLVAEYKELIENKNLRHRIYGVRPYVLH